MNSDMRKRAQTLRTNVTKEENKLWYQFLRTYPVQWNRQKVIGGYIVDFYCAKATLIVELDGGGHYDPKEELRDTARTKELEKLGLEVVRFSNADVDKNFEGVCTAIDLKVKSRLPL